MNIRKLILAIIFLLNSSIIGSSVTALVNVDFTSIPGLFSGAGPSITSQVLNTTGGPVTINFTISATAVSGSSVFYNDVTNGGITVGNSAIDNGEGVTFGLNIISVTGGTATFDGFTNVTLNDFTNTTETAVISLNNVLDVSDPTFNSAPISLSGVDDGTPTGFTIFSPTANFPAPANAFVVRGVGLSFDVVPEPSTALMLSFGSLFLLKRRKRA